MSGNSLVNYEFGHVDCSRLTSKHVVAGAFVCKTVQRATPVAAATVAIANTTAGLILEPAGTLATLTITLPTAPRDGQLLFISTIAAITSLTVSGGTFGANQAPTALAAGESIRFVFQATGSKWFKA